MFEGMLTALVTPFRDNAVDEAALRKLVERQMAAGVDGLVPCGSTGESATLSHEEHRRVVEIVVDSVAGRVPVVAGTGSNNTREAVELTRHARDAGAQGALLISPYYNKPTQEGLLAHYRTVADEVELPLMVYNIPGRTASNVLPDTLATLALHPLIVGVKEASGNLEQMAEVIRVCPSDFVVLSGDDALTLPLLAIGGQGVISTTSNVAPDAMCELTQAFRDADLKRAQKVHYRLLPLFDALFRETNPIPVKAALAEMGLIESEIRLPLLPLSEPHREPLRAALKMLGLLE